MMPTASPCFRIERHILQRPENPGNGSRVENRRNGAFTELTIASRTVRLPGKLLKKKRIVPEPCTPKRYSGFIPPGTLFTAGKIRRHTLLKLAPRTVTLDRIKIKGHIRKPARGLDIMIEPEDEGLVLSNEESGLLIPAPNLEEGIGGISEELATLFDVYVNEKPENLNTDAMRLRKNLQSLVPAGAKA